MRIPRKLKKRLTNNRTFWQHREHPLVICVLTRRRKGSYWVRSGKWVWKDDKKRKKSNGKFYQYCEEEYRHKTIEIETFLPAFKEISWKQYCNVWGTILIKA